MGNTEGTLQPGDSVETTRETSTREDAQSETGSGCPYCGVLATSSPEALLNRAFRKLSISFTTQQIVYTRDKTRSGRGLPAGAYHVDLLIAQAPVVVEADEPYHQLQREQREHDARKDADLRTAGYQVFRFTEQAIGEDADACAELVAAAAQLIPEDYPVFIVRRMMAGIDSPTWKGGKLGWDCATCGWHFHAYLRNGKPRMTCSRECQAIWQTETGASVRNRRSNSESMRKLWADPEWRIQQIRLQRAGRWGVVDGDIVRTAVDGKPAELPGD